MEEAGLSVDAGSMGQLDHEQLDHEHQFDFEAEGFDFNLDGVYDESAQAVGVGAVADVADNDEIGYEDDEEDVQPGSAQLGQTETLEVVNDLGADAETEGEAKDAVVDFNDEIGYEEDDFAVGDISIDLKSEKAVELVSEVSADQPHEHAEPNQEAYDQSGQIQLEAQSELAKAEDIAAPNEEPEPTEHAEDEAMHDHPVDEDKENRVDFDNHDDGVVDEEYPDESMLENYFVDQDEDLSQGPSDLDKAIEDLTNSLPSIPEVEILYNDGSYSLFGAADDDPETFFLSGTKHLDKSLGELLSSLRQVLGEEIRPTDDLLISVEALGLEFGERSNQKFLARSLRELLDCHASLATKNYGDFPTQPTLRLMVQQDCEEQFLQLLQEAELEAESPDDSEDYDASEQQDEWPSANPPGDGQSQQAAQADQAEQASSQEQSVHDDDVASAALGPDAASASLNGDNDQTITSMEQGFSFEDTLDDPEYQASEAADASEERLDEHMDDYTDKQVENHIEEHTEEHVKHGEVPEEQGAEEQVEEPAEVHTANSTAHEAVYSVNTSHEVSVDIQGVEQQGEVFENDNGGFEDFDEYVAAETGGVEQTAGSNGNNPSLLSPTFDISLSEMKSSCVSPLGNAAPATDRLAEPNQQQSGQEEDYLIDYSDDDYDDYDTPSSAKQVVEARSMSSIESPYRRRFFTSHSRTGSCQSFTYSHASDANFPDFQDDDLMLGYDNDAGLSTIEEQQDDDYDDITVTLNPENNANIAGNIGSGDDRNTQHGAPSHEPLQEAHTATGDTESIHTSTTMNADEIDYDEHDAEVDDSFTPGNSVQQSAASLGGEDDEIDWENDGYELHQEEEQNGADESFASEEQIEVALTPSSLAAKRSRTDEEESLAEESGMTEFPPFKRVKRC
ncbi:hypothetical protein QBC43DRAFT_198933 [Cladorrhinum sp. PSN259]|nr:hypothetical protein QBC43DRAFT_198933 [Cladorrhinum sp. PSN259]